MGFDWPLPSTATVTPASGANAAGETTFGTAFEAACRFQRTTRFVRLPDSITITTDAVIFFEADISINQKDKITVGSYSGTVIEIQPQEDIEGDASHLEVLTRTA